MGIRSNSQVYLNYNIWEYGMEIERKNPPHEDSKLKIGPRGLPGIGMVKMHQKMFYWIQVLNYER